MILWVSKTFGVSSIIRVVTYLHVGNNKVNKLKSISVNSIRLIDLDKPTLDLLLLSVKLIFIQIISSLSLRLIAHVLYRPLLWKTQKFTIYVDRKWIGNYIEITILKVASQSTNFKELKKPSSAKIVSLFSLLVEDTGLQKKIVFFYPTCR